MALFPTQPLSVQQLPPTVLISHKPRASLVVQDYAPDFVHNYACAVLNDGMLMLEFRDAIYEGDGNCILRVCKFLLLQFRYAGRKKHALEAFHKLAADSSRKTYKNILSQHNLSHSLTLFISWIVVAKSLDSIQIATWMISSDIHAPWPPYFRPQP